LACSKIGPNIRTTAAVKIRPADLADAVAIATCLLEAFTPYRLAYTPGAFADTVPTVDQVQLRVQQMHVLVAAAVGEVVGTISASSDREQGRLGGVAVLPEWRGTGTALMLLAPIEDWLRIRGCKQVTLDTTEPLKPAIAFHEKHRYRRSGHVSDLFGMPLIEYVKRL
jgi:GNAT superfamily N-acetyltransferase